jgi:type II secretory pathway predicted ATPase ExeA
MYLKKFALQRQPFAPIPEPGLYYPGEAIESARQSLTRLLGRAEGAGMVVGPSGSGKTLLLQVLKRQFLSQMEVALLGSGRLATIRALYQSILFELGCEYRGLDDGELRFSLDEHISRKDCPGLVLLVDEAHTLSLKLLDEIRMMTNRCESGRSRVRVVLAGSPVLEERFTHPKLDSFTQRLVARAYLEPFGKSETTRFIRAQVDLAGGSGVGFFGAEATEAVYQATGGVPRLINQLCDQSLLLASQKGLSKVTAREVEFAWAELQQLPTPMSDEPAESDNGAGGSVIEFGSLDGPSEIDSAPLETAVFEPVVETDAEIACLTDDQTSFSVEYVEEPEEISGSIDYGSDKSLGRPQLAVAVPPEDMTPEPEVDPFNEAFEQEEVVAPCYDIEVAEALSKVLSAPSDQLQLGNLSVDPPLENDYGVQPSQENGERLLDNGIIILDDEQKSQGNAAAPSRICVARGSEILSIFTKMRRA